MDPILIWLFSQRKFILYERQWKYISILFRIQVSRIEMAKTEFPVWKC